MTKIQVYSDETKCDNGSFLIYSMIYGKPDNIAALNQELKNVIRPKDSNESDFKGLHSYKLNEGNWHTIGKRFENSLDILKKYIIEDKVDAKLIILGTEKNDNNVGYLKSLFKNELQKQGSKINEMFKSLDINDHPALYHRLDQLFLYFIYRDRLGPKGTYFELFPDSSGKILSYKEKEFNVTGSDNLSADLKFYDLIKVLGNTVSKVIASLKFVGWSNSEQEIDKVEPLKWSDSYIIQLCDVLANFFFCHLRFEVGLLDKKYELKSNAIASRFALQNMSSKINASFDIKDNEVNCKDKLAFFTIDINKK